jgi:hypothetical protein
MTFSVANQLRDRNQTYDLSATFATSPLAAKPRYSRLPATRPTRTQHKPQPWTNRGPRYGTKTSGVTFTRLAVAPPGAREVCFQEKACFCRTGRNQQSAYFSARPRLGAGQCRRLTDEENSTSAALNHTCRLYQERRKTWDPRRIVIQPRVEPFKHTTPFVGRPTNTSFSSRVFRTLRISSCEKNMVLESGLYPTEESSDEKDGSFNARNSGASERGIDLFVC